MSKPSYSEQLKDPRWQKKRLEIFNRDKFTCVQCGNFKSTLHVHHANGYQNGLMPWEYPDVELLTLCESCHTKEHTPVRPLKIYLAGKIEHTCWRHGIVSDLRSGGATGACGAETGDDFPIIMEGAVLGFHHYVGPFFVSCDHGCFHGPGSHGSAAKEWDDSDSNNPIITGYNTAHRNAAFHRAVMGIASCDLFFAWIDSTDCFGTISEIGMAHGMAKPIALGVTSSFPDDLWFVNQCASFTTLASNPKEALERSLGWVETVGKL